MLDSAGHVTASLSLLADKRLLILGGCGFLGRWVIEAAKSYGAKITVLDNAPSGHEAPPARIIRENLLNSTSLEGLIAESDLVVHLMGTLGTESTFNGLASTMESNVVGTARVIECCLKHGRRAVYPMVGNDWLNPYTISRRCASDLGIMANLESDGDFRILRIMNAYGAWQSYGATHKIIPTFTRQCFLDKTIEIFGDGNQCIDLIHARDVAVAILLACVVNDLPREKFMEVGTGIPYRVIEVAKLILEMTASSAAIHFAGKRKGEPMHSVTLAREDTLRSLTGFEPQTSLEQGLYETLVWYMEHPMFLGIDGDGAGTMGIERFKRRVSIVNPTGNCLA